MFSTEYEYVHTGTTIRVAVQPSFPTHEPRVQWEVDDQQGDAGYIHLDTTEPVVRLEDGETIAFDGAVVAAFPIARRLGERLRAECERRGRVVATADRIGTDPTVFPAEIARFERVGWEAPRHVMWYLRRRERETPTRARTRSSVASSSFVPRSGRTALATSVGRSVRVGRGVVIEYIEFQ